MATSDESSDRAAGARADLRLITAIVVSYFIVISTLGLLQVVSFFGWGVWVISGVALPLILGFSTFLALVLALVCVATATRAVNEPESKDEGIASFGLAGVALCGLAPTALLVAPFVSA